MPSPTPPDFEASTAKPRRAGTSDQWGKLLADVQDAEATDIFTDPELSSAVLGEIAARASWRLQTAVERGATPDFSTVLLKIQRQDNTKGALEALLAEASHYRVTAIRLYRHIRVSGDSMLVSMDCAGHDEVVSNHLRIGQIAKLRSKSPTATHDSFWCIDRRQPVVFRIDEEASDELREQTLDGDLGVVSLKANQCENSLVMHESGAWIDFPLEVCGKVVGKLSCDIAAGELEPGAADLRRLGDLVRMLAPYLHFLCGSQLDRPLQELAVEVNTIGSIDELFDFCVRRLPQTIRAKYASVFTVSSDSAGSRQLILRRTSFPASKALEETRYGTYRLEEKGLTPWIARSGISIYLPDLDDAELRQRKLECYDPELRWAKKVPDSDGHGDFLGVSIRQGANTVGVLRFTQCQDSGGAAAGHFAPHDQILIEQVARHVIAPKLLSLTRAEANLRLSRHLDVLRRFWRASRASDDFKTFLPQIESVLEAFCDSFGAAKAIIYFDRNAEVWQTFGSLGGGDPKIRQGLAQFALSRPGCVFVNQLDQFRDKNSRPAAEPAVCGLGVRVVAMGNPYGCIVVLSEHYDLSVEAHGPILEQLASELDELIVRRRIFKRVAPLLKVPPDSRVAVRRQTLRLLAENPGVITSDSVEELWGVLKPMVRPKYETVPVVELIRTIRKIARVRVSRRAEGVRIELAVALRLAGAVLNLLRRYEACPTVARVRTEARRDGWLDVSITPAPEVEERNGLEAVRLLAQCRSGDGRCGELRIDPGICATLRIPIAQA